MKTLEKSDKEQKKNDNTKWAEAGHTWKYVEVRAIFYFDQDEEYRTNTSTSLYPAELAPKCETCMYCWICACYIKQTSRKFNQQAYFNETAESAKKTPSTWTSTVSPFVVFSKKTEVI